MFAMVEALPLITATLCGIAAGLTGTILVDWMIGLICLAGGVVAGLILGFVIHALLSVLLIYAKVGAEIRYGRNYIPLYCGLGAAVFALVRMLLDPRGTEIGVLVFGCIVSFTLAAGIGVAAQDISRRVTRFARSRRGL